MSYLNSDYGDWFMDNLEENIERYVEETVPNPDKWEKAKKVLSDKYNDTYDKDENFEKWCQDYAIFLESMAIDEAADRRYEE